MTHLERQHNNTASLNNNAHGPYNKIWYDIQILLQNFNQVVIVFYNFALFEKENRLAQNMLQNANEVA